MIKCPKCESSSIARIVYGMPMFDAKTEDDLAKGRIVLGGCEIIDNAPTKHCNNCKHQWRMIRQPKIKQPQKTVVPTENADENNLRQTDELITVVLPIINNN